MSFRPAVLTAIVAISGLTLVQSASAQTYPTKPIHLIVPYPAGGGTDFFARRIAALTPRSELPGVPPVAAVPGLAGFEAWPWQGFVVPAKTSDAVIGKLHATYVAAVADPVVRQKLIDAGTEALQSSPQEMAEHMRKEAAKWAEVIRTAKIQLD
jgi:tripartite-type tricarboxylate transporter receptor subunit TctC